MVLPGADPWHHLRQIEQWARHFPHRVAFDSYALHPGGQRSVTAPLFDLLAAFVAWIAGAGAPADTTVATVAALLPPLLGGLVCIVTYRLARRVTGRGGALVAVLAVAALPGQLFLRTMLGFADHHALEAVLAPLSVLLLARAVSRSAGGDAGRAGLAAGVVLAFFLYTWPGAALLVLVFALFAAVQVNVDHLRGVACSPTVRAVVAACGLAAIAVAPSAGWLPGARYQLIALCGAILAAAGPAWLGGVLRRRGAPRRLLPLYTMGCALAVAAVAFTLSPGLPAALGWFAASGVQETVGEAQPLLVQDGEFSLLPAWAAFGVTLPLALAGVAILVARVLRTGRAVDTLLALWTAVMLLATLGQNRFGYYSTVCAGVCIGVVLGPWLARLWSGEMRRPPAAWIRRGLWPLTVAVALVLPLGEGVRSLAGKHRGPRQGWLDCLEWLRTATPEPFGDAAYFEARYGDAPPPPEYGVLAWWDAGYWITHTARRVPVSNPTQSNAREAALALTAQDEEHAAMLVERLGARYVVVDTETPLYPVAGDEYEGEIGQLFRWADRAADEVAEMYYRKLDDGSLAPSLLFHEAYFRSLVVRLHTFRGRGFEPEWASAVVRWHDEPAADGETVRVIDDYETFETYAEARAALGDGGSGNARIVSDDATESCVPLRRLTRFREVWASEQPGVIYLEEPIPDVQVYELTAR